MLLFLVAGNHVIDRVSGDDEVLQRQVEVWFMTKISVFLQTSDNLEFTKLIALSNNFTIILA